MSLQY